MLKTVLAYANRLFLCPKISSISKNFRLYKSPTHLQGLHKAMTQELTLAKECCLPTLLNPFAQLKQLRFEREKGMRITRVFAISGRDIVSFGFSSLLYRISWLDVNYFAFKHILHFSFSIGICFGGRNSEAPAIANTCRWWQV